jgi:glycosyltransferase involved in cell wall biosynthesis
MLESVHTARWLNEIKDMGWDIHLYPSTIWKVHPSIKNVTIHGIPLRSENSDKSLTFDRSIPFIWKTPDKINTFIQLLYGNLHDNLRYEKYRTNQLVKVIKRIKPDLIHTLEMQHAGYLTLGAKKIIGESFPPWIYTPWGNDIYFFGRLPEHAIKIKEVLNACNYYLPKSERDIALAKKFGFKGEFLTKLPGNGGFDTIKLKERWQPGKCSDRKIIMVKGYQGTMNRALVALRAIELCSDVLQDYTILLYSATNEEVKIKSELIFNETELDIKVIPAQSHENMLNLYGKARISISVNLSDGVSNSLLESMVMGAFPIESNTSCANEWITHQKTGCIISPEDPTDIVNSIKFALEHDDIINQSAEINFQSAHAMLDKSIINPKIMSLYANIFNLLTC